MDSIQRKIIDALSYIKLTKARNSKELDGFLVKDLYEQGLIEGCLSQEVTERGKAPVLYELRLTLAGEHYLEESLKLKSSNWRSSPLVIGFITFIFTVLASGVIYYLGWK